MKDLRNKAVEHFFLDTIPKKENISRDLCSLWLHRFYLEACNPEKYNSALYKNQDERIDAAFPEMPEKIKNLFKLKAYKHRADQHGEIDGEKETRIVELEIAVAKTEYQEFVPLQWWENEAVI